MTVMDALLDPQVIGYLALAFIVGVALLTYPVRLLRRAIRYQRVRKELQAASRLSMPPVIPFRYPREVVAARHRLAASGHAVHELQIEDYDDEVLG